MVIEKKHFHSVDFSEGPIQVMVVVIYDEIL